MASPTAAVRDARSQRRDASPSAKDDAGAFHRVRVGRRAGMSHGTAAAGAAAALTAAGAGRPQLRLRLIHDGSGGGGKRARPMTGLTATARPPHLMSLLGLAPIFHLSGYRSGSRDGTK